MGDGGPGAIFFLFFGLFVCLLWFAVFSGISGRTRRRRWFLVGIAPLIAFVALVYSVVQGMYS